MKNVHSQLKEVFGSGLKTNEPLRAYTTIKIGGPADYFVEATTVEHIVAAVKIAQQGNIPVFLLGGGSNILIGDDGIAGLVIKNSTNRISVRGIKGKRTRGVTKQLVYVEADSGVPFNRLVRFTIDEGLAGFEMHLGLPGSVGGAIYMNAKWTNPEAFVGDKVYQADILTSQCERKTVPRSFFHFAYDESIIQKTGDIVLRVIFALESGSKEALWKTANTSIQYRRESQPQGVFSAGCTFQNISKATAMSLSTPSYTTSAGFLIDKAGLKGLRVGDAQISPMHANFIINRGNAKAGDVIELIRRAKEQVKRQFGVELTEEIVCVGEF